MAKYEKIKIKIKEYAHHFSWGEVTNKAKQHIGHFFSINFAQSLSNSKTSKLKKHGKMIAK